MPQPEKGDKTEFDNLPYPHWLQFELKHKYCIYTNIKGYTHY